MAIILADWMPINDHTPKDHPILVYAPAREGLPPIISICQWHPDAGFCICELRQPTIWTMLPYVPEHLQS